MPAATARTPWEQERRAGTQAFRQLLPDNTRRTQQGPRSGKTPRAAGQEALLRGPGQRLGPDVALRTEWGAAHAGARWSPPAPGESRPPQEPVAEKGLTVTAFAS